MDKNKILWAILVVSVCGILFSGFLTLKEYGVIAGEGCAISGMKILGLPVCVYGLMMYWVVFWLAFMGLRVGNEKKN